jgi:hypothetical protein
MRRFRNSLVPGSDPITRVSRAVAPQPVHLQSVDGERAWVSVTPEGDAVRLVVPIEGNGDYDLVITAAAAQLLATELAAAAGVSE